jgi:hypothetical protein
VYALTAGFLARALVKQLMSSRRDALQRRSRAGQRGRHSQTLLRARHTERLEAEEPARHGQALLARYAEMVEGSRLVRRVRWNCKVSGQEWGEASVVSLPELRSRSYHERLGGLRSIGWFLGFVASGRRT